MYQQKSTETVTLTRTQLQAILELITKLGGMNMADTRQESKAINFNPKISPLKVDNEEQANNQFYNNKVEDWKQESKQELNKDEWLSFKESNAHYNHFKPPSRPNSLFSSRMASPLGSDHSSTGSESNLRAASDSKFRRYARINNFEFDMNALKQKRLKEEEYGRALDEQRDEKMRERRAEKERQRLEEELWEQRLCEQQSRMRCEYESEQRKLAERRELAERKRAAVIAAIEKTPPVRKKFLADQENGGSGQQPIATILPQTRTEDKAIQFCDKSVQTDVQLLFQWLLQIKQSATDQIAASTGESSPSPAADTSVAAIKPKTRSFTAKVLPNNSTPKRVAHESRPVWGVSAHSRSSYVKNTDKYLGKKLQEMRKNYWEKESQNHSKKKDKNQTNKRAANETISSDSSVAKESPEMPTEVESKKLFQRRRKSLTLPPSAALLAVPNGGGSRRNSAIQSSSLNFLPQIDSRPQSRKKWYSQEAFDPNLLN